MSDDNESIVMIVELTKELSNILEGVHIQSWINLIKYDITRFEKFQLQNLYLSTLSPTKTHIEISSQKIPLNMKWHYQRFDNLLEGKKGLLGSSFDIVDGSQKLKKFYSFDLWYLLKRHKNSKFTSQIGGKSSDINMIQIGESFGGKQLLCWLIKERLLSFKHNSLISYHGVLRMSHDTHRKCWFTRAIFTEYTVVQSTLKLSLEIF